MFVAIVMKIKNRRMFKNPAHTGRHPYVVRLTAYPCTQGTCTASEPANTYAGLAGLIQGVTSAGLEQGIHVGHDTGGAALFGMVDFVADKRQHSSVQRERRLQQALERPARAQPGQ